MTKEEKLYCMRELSRWAHSNGITFTTEQLSSLTRKAAQLHREGVLGD